MKGKTGSDYAYRMNVQRVNVHFLLDFLKEKNISIRGLAKMPEISVTESTLRSWIKREEMPSYLVTEICEALDLVSTYRYTQDFPDGITNIRVEFRRKTDENAKLVKLHARIGIEVNVPRDILEGILNHAISGANGGIWNGTVEDLLVVDEPLDDDAAQMFIDQGVPAWNHYIPAEWLIQDAKAAGLIKNFREQFRKKEV